MPFSAEDEARIRRERAKEAIALAMQSRWEEAVEVNRRALELFPDDGEAFNRLGKALSELGRYSEAREAFQRALELSPINSIAKKNLERLKGLKDEDRPAVSAGRKAASSFFIEESGKSGFTVLQSVNQERLVDLAPGDLVTLKVDAQRLLALSGDGRYLGEVEPRLSRRLIPLIEGGNWYEAAIASLESERLELVIREIYQHPSQAGQVAFTTHKAGELQPHFKSTLLKYDLEEDLYSELPVEWEQEVEEEVLVEKSEIVTEEEEVPLSEAEAAEEETEEEEEY